MMLDAMLQLSSGQAVTASAVSTNTIDLSQNRDLASGDTLVALFTVDSTVTAAGAATVNFQIISSASANLSSPTILAQSGPIPKADLTAGRAPFSVGLAQNASLAVSIGQRYIGVQYLVSTGPLTAGAFSCCLSTDSNVSKIYPGNYTVA